MTPISLEAVVVKMCEGNPGALNVCCQLIKVGDDGVFRLLDADDMDLRGPALWVAYNDFAGCDLDVLCEALLARSAKLVAAVHAAGYHAVEHGASRRGLP